MLSTAIDRVRRLVGSSDGSSGDDNPDRDDPDLYECEGCGVVFISEPETCSNCDHEDFSNVGKFE
ncbi:hypothetical protein BRC82_09585 [Halobacteriales archaeon QS_1_67_19]|nr:MAG: hypothetical protein BRC82_09585 [Halobacteriales archaeon QS_1_67_19]